MILPSYKLNQLDFYEFYPMKEGKAVLTREDVVILHWQRKWFEFWKNRTTKMVWRCPEEYKGGKGGIIHFYPNQQASELVAQLEEWARTVGETREKINLLKSNSWNKKAKQSIL